MARSKFNPQTRGAVIERFAAGMTVNDTCAAVGIKDKTLRHWLVRGRAEETGLYADFVRAVDEAKADAAARPEPLTEDEHRRLVAEAARKGSVAALKLAWEMILADRTSEKTEDKSEDPFDTVDELARRRAA